MKLINFENNKSLIYSNSVQTLGVYIYASFSISIFLLVVATRSLAASNAQLICMSKLLDSASHPYITNKATQVWFSLIAVSGYVESLVVGHVSTNRFLSSLKEISHVSTSIKGSKAPAASIFPIYAALEAPSLAFAAAFWSRRDTSYRRRRMFAFVALLLSRTPYSFSRRGSRCRTPTLNISLSSSSAFCSSY